MEDYFSHFGLNRSFRITAADVRQKYLTKSRELHPDINQHIQDMDEMERAAAYNNAAYATLSKEDTLFPYLLDLHNIKIQASDLSPDFLMEMMDLNEEVEEARAAGSNEVLAAKTNQINLLMEAMRVKLEPVLVSYEAGDFDNALQSIADYVLRINYLKRLLSIINGTVEL